MGKAAQGSSSCLKTDPLDLVYLVVCGALWCLQAWLLPPGQPLWFLLTSATLQCWAPVHQPGQAPTRTMSSTAQHGLQSVWACCATRNPAATSHR